MNREVKFRGISRKSNTWIYGLPFYSYGVEEWKITHSNGWMPSYYNPDEGETTMYVGIEVETLTQFTGLKDKNGKEIYEGDIVRVHTEVPVCEKLSQWQEDFNCVEAEINCVVYYNIEFASFDLRTIKKHKNLDNWGFFGNEVPNTLEVIGNIFENKELLEK